MMLRDKMIDQWIKELDKEILDLQELREEFSGEEQDEAVKVLTDPDYRAEVGNIGDGIRIRRKNAKMTQEDLAGEIGISQPMLAQIERGSKVPSMILGRQIARVFKCSMEELFEEAGV